MTASIPTEPIMIGTHSVLVKFFAMPRQQDDPRRIEGTFTLVGPEGVLTLDALIGPQGIPGEPSPIIRPQWDADIEDAGDLPDSDTLDETDDGRAWYIDGSWHVYSDHDGDYHIITGSVPGPTGLTPAVTFSAEVIEAEDPIVYGDIEVDQSGTSTSPHFHMKIPGVRGPEGPASSIDLASDYDDSVGAEPGDFLIMGDEGKWMPGTPTLFVPRKYTVPRASFIPYSGSGSPQLIASLNIPAQEFDWYPDVLGHISIARNLLSSQMVEVHVRIGITGASTGTMEPLCGFGPFDPSWTLVDAATVVHILPDFSSPAYPGRAIDPFTSEGRFYAGDPATVYVFLVSIGGFGGFTFPGDMAHLRVDVVPAIN